MASVHDVAAYILQKQGDMSTWKFQKLVYYSQAWHLAWDEEPLFNARIEAWANGPVVPELYRLHRGRFTISAWPEGDPDSIAEAGRDTIDAVLSSYGKLTGRQLSHLAHAEDPWRRARGDLTPTDRSTRLISPQSMQQFYAALDADAEAPTIDSIDWSSPV